MSIVYCQLLKYRPAMEVERGDSPLNLSGDPSLPDFTLKLEKIWEVKPIRFFNADEQEDSATELVSQALSTSIVFPCFAWAEVASVLRKKVTSGLLSSDEANQLYSELAKPLTFKTGNLSISCSSIS